jgi:hypothetical protein
MGALVSTLFPSGAHTAITCRHGSPHLDPPCLEVEPHFIFFTYILAMSQEGSHHFEVTLWFPMHLLLMSRFLLLHCFFFILLTTIAVTLDLFPFSLACYHFVTITSRENICYEWTSLSKYPVAFTFPRSVPSSWNIDAYCSTTHSL